VGNGASVTVSTCNPGTDFDTKLGVFSGSCGALTCIGGNDDTTAPECVLPATGFNRKSRVTFQSTAGTTYYVLVTGFGTAAGNFELSVTCATAPPPVSFNECAGAITLTPGATCVPTSGTNVGATQSVAPITCDGFTSNSALDVWYKFTATQATHAVIVNGGTTFDAVVDVRSGACNGTTIGCSDDQILSGASEVVLLNSLTAGQTYLIRIYGWFGATGNFTVCVTNGVTTLSELTDGVAAGNDVLGTITNEVVVGNVYPNPVQTELAYINIATPQDETATIQIVDQMGRIVRSMNTPLAQGANKVDLNLDGLATGAYFAAINIGGQMFRKMIVINR
jgi:hypothetical protein